MIMTKRYNKKIQEYEDDLLAGRGKAYGAYHVRRRKNEMAFKGLLAGILLVGILYLSLFLWITLQRQKRTGSIKTEQMQVVTYSELMAPPPIETVIPQQQKLEEALQVSTVKYTKPLIKPDNEVFEEDYIPTQQDLQHANPGTATLAGIDSVVVNQVEVSAPVEKEEIYVSFEKAPEFVGGIQAMNEYLLKELKYPQLARELRIQGMVIVQFVVGKDGSITEAEVVRGIGGGCDEEALRVVQAMPNWIPGVQNKKQVRVRYAIPIRFILQE